MSIVVVLSLLVDSSLSQSTSTICDDAYECESSIISTTYTYCYGYFGCDEASINSTYVYNYGSYASYLADIASTYVYSYGFRANYYASMAVSYVYSYGFQSSLYADLEPKDGTLVTYLFGYYAGYYADIQCYSGDTCYVYCGSAYGCYNTKFYCYSEATCYYDCSDDPNYCPTLYSGIGSQITSEGNVVTPKHFNMLKDDQINKLREDNKQIKKQHSESQAENNPKLVNMAKDKARRVINNDHHGKEHMHVIPGKEHNDINVNRELDLLSVGSKLILTSQPHQSSNILDKIAYSGYAPLIYGCIGGLIVLLLIFTIKKYKQYSQKSVNNSEYEPILA